MNALLHFIHELIEDGGVERMEGKDQWTIPKLKYKSISHGAYTDTDEEKKKNGDYTDGIDKNLVTNQLLNFFQM